MREINVKDVVDRLIGESYPSGDNDLDQQRLENLKNKIELVDSILDDIIEAANFSEDPRASMREIGEYADNYLRNTCAWLTEMFLED